MVNIPHNYSLLWLSELDTHHSQINRGINPGGRLSRFFEYHIHALKGKVSNRKRGRQRKRGRKRALERKGQSLLSEYINCGDTDTETIRSMSVCDDKGLQCGVELFNNVEDFGTHAYDLGIYGRVETLFIEAFVGTHAGFVCALETIINVLLLFSILDGFYFFIFYFF
jgi:hypothetical protein